jgi:hypothetical protein
MLPTRLLLTLPLLLLPATTRAQDVPVRLEPRGAGRIHASVVVGWHSEPYRAARVTAHYVYHYTAWRRVPETASLCLAPCETALPSGPSQLLLHDGEGPMMTNEFLPVPGATLRLSMDRHGAERGLGHLSFWLGLLGTLTGACFAGTDRFLDELNRGDPNYRSFLSAELELGAWIATGASAALWLLVGLPLMGQSDRAHVEVIPGGVRF